MTLRLTEMREQLGLSFAILGCGGVATPGDYRSIGQQARTP